MIRRSVALVAMLAMTGTALGQAPAPPPQSPPQSQWQGRHGWRPTEEWRQKMEENRMNRLSLLLDLSPTQRQKVQAILADEQARMRAAMQQVRQAMMQARATHQAVHKDTVQRLSSVLSPTQMKKFQALMPGPGMMHGMMMRGMMMHGMMMHPMMQGGMGPGMHMGPQHPPGPGPGPR